MECLELQPYFQAKQLLVEKITQRLTKIPKPVAFGSAMQDYLVLEPADKQEMFPKNKLRQRPVIWMSEMEKITCNDIHGDLPLAIKTSGIMMEISTLHLCVLESTSARALPHCPSWSLPAVPSMRHGIAAQSLQGWHIWSDIG